MSKEKTYVIDTNGLINNPHIIKEKNVIITSLVLRELESLERRKSDRRLQYSIRVAKRIVEEMIEEDNIDIIDIDGSETLSGYSESYVDNNIIHYALVNGYGIISDDILLKHKAMAHDIEVINSSDQEGEMEYKGYKTVVLSQDEVIEFYSDITHNMYGLLVNEYIAIKDESNKVIDVLIWDGRWHVSIFRANKNNDLTIAGTNQFERIKSRDEQQAMVIHSLNNNQVTMVRGRAGSGKTMLSLYYAWNKVEKDDARLVIFFNPAPSKDSIEMGFFKGDMISKALQSSLGTMLKSKFGDEDILFEYIANGRIEILPFTDLRGWDSKSDRETVVLISEAQNLTSELLKMGLQRIDEETTVIIDGDYNQQIDRDTYLHSNGMKRASEVLKGSELYGEVELQNVYRSELADIVEEM